MNLEQTKTATEAFVRHYNVQRPHQGHTSGNRPPLTAFPQLKALPLKGTVGHLLSFEQFLAHMLHQVRAQARLRSLQERKYRTAAFATP